MDSGSAILLHRGNGDLPATQTAVAGTSGNGLKSVTLGTRSRAPESLVTTSEIAPTGRQRFLIAGEQRRFRHNRLSRRFFTPRLVAATCAFFRCRKRV